MKSNKKSICCCPPPHRRHTAFPKLSLLSFTLLLLLMICSVALSAQGKEDKLFSVLGAEKQELSIKLPEGSNWLEKTIAIFKDTSGHATFEDVVAKPEWFGPNTSRDNLDPAGIYWMKINFQVGAQYRDSCDFIFHYGYGRYSWDEIDAYLVHQNGSIEHQRTGHALPRAEKSLPWNASTVRFGFNAGETATLYVRVAGTSPQKQPTVLSAFVEHGAKLSNNNYNDSYHFSGQYYYGYPTQSPFKGNNVLIAGVLEAPDPSLTLEDILNEQENLAWEENNLNVVPEKGKVYWAKTRLCGSNTFQGEHIFHVSFYGNDTHTFDYVDIYTLKKGALLAHQRTGNAVPSWERPYNFWASFFKVALAPTDTIDLYLRVEGLNKLFPANNIRLFHVDPTSLFPKQVQAARKSMFILGAIAIQFIFFFLLFLVERERIHFYFSVLILGVFLVLTNHYPNFLSFVPIAEFSQYYYELSSLGSLLLYIGLIKFTQTYFNYPPKSVYSRWIIPAFVLLHLSVFFTRLVIGPNPSILNFSSGLILTQLLFVFWLAMVAEKQTRKLKIIFLISFTPGLIAIFFSTLPVLPLFDYPDWVYSDIWVKSYPFDILFIIVVLSLSIGYRKNLLRREKDQALQANLEAQETIIEKLEETAKLEKRDEVKTRFFTNISHEFRTPLTVILGMTDQLRATSNKNELSTGIDLIDRNGKKLLQLTNQLLDLSKIDAANLKVNYQNKEVVAFIQYLGESFESLADKKGVRLSIYSEIDELTMAIDPDKLQKIIANLLSNAIKFTPARAKVVLHLTRNEKQLLIKVRDTGEGISAAALPHIFDRFYQVDNASSRKGEGTGIGLALVKELVALLEGDVQVESELGRGTVFTVSLPIRTVDEADMDTSDIESLPVVPIISPTTSFIQTHPVAPVEEVLLPPISRLLIVEDNPDVVYYLQSVLEGQYEILIATDGQLGIDMALEQIPDIIISDVMMSEKDGFELVEVLKTDERSSHIPIILLTAKATQTDKLTGLRHGADAYLMKPFDKEELLLRLQKLLENRQVLQRKYSKQLPIATIGGAETAEDRFINKVQQLLDEHFEDADLSVKDLAKMLHLSHQQFYRKLKALTNQTPVRYLRSFRLRKAKTLLESGADLNVSEVAYEVGFDNPNYFSRVFSEEFGMTPNQFRNQS